MNRRKQLVNTRDRGNQFIRDTKWRRISEEDEMRVADVGIQDWR